MITSVGKFLRSGVDPKKPMVIKKTNKLSSGIPCIKLYMIYTFDSNIKEFKF
jgi:hypothetical protein